jgi:conjugative transfer signal peptidase TraF
VVARNRAGFCTQEGRNAVTSPLRPLRTWPVAGAALLIAALGTVSLARPRPLLIWNGSASAPTGLYRVTETGNPVHGDRVAARLPVPWRVLAARRHYLPANVPLIKRIAAIPGDMVCASGDRVTVNGDVAALRLRRDGAGRPMPAWHGCRRLGAGDVLLLAAHPASFDGRYFGPSQRRDILGKAHLIWQHP